MLVAFWLVSINWDQLGKRHPDWKPCVAGGHVMLARTANMAEPAAARSAEFPGLVASFFTLSGAGFVEPPRNSFIERCEAAAAAGFSGIGLHHEDLSRTIAAGVESPDAGGSSHTTD